MIGQHQSTDTMRHWHIRALLRERDLNAGRSPGDERGEATLADAKKRFVDVIGIGFALDDVEDGDVAGFLAGKGRDHAVLVLEETPHDVKDGGLAHRLGLLDVVAGEGGVGRHEEVAPGSGDQGGDDTDEVVVHIAWVTQRGRAGRHDGGDLGKRQGSTENGTRMERGLGSDVRAGWSAGRTVLAREVGPLRYGRGRRCRGPPGASGVSGRILHRAKWSRTAAATYHRVCVLGQPSHGEETVVWMHHDVASALGIWKDRVCLDELLRKPIIQSL